MPHRYQPFPQTHWSLVQRAGISDEASRLEALTVLLQRYSPALHSYLRIKHIDVDNRNELLQGFIAEKLMDPGFLQRADPNRGRFRTFILVSLDNYVADAYRKAVIRRTVTLSESTTPLRASEAEAAVETAWARELVRNVLHQMQQYCRDNDRGDLWTVFEGRVLRQAFGTDEPISYEVLAAEAGVDSPTKAANLLVSAKRLYERLLRRAIGEYEQDEKAIDAEIAELRKALSRHRPMTQEENE